MGLSSQRNIHLSILIYQEDVGHSPLKIGFLSHCLFRVLDLLVLLAEAGVVSGAHGNVL